MPFPPQSLRIKRKRVDEPVNALYIERAGEDQSTGDPQRRLTKRRTTEQFVFQRVQDDEADFPLLNLLARQSEQVPNAAQDSASTGAATQARRFHMAQPLPPVGSSSPSKRKSSAPHVQAHDKLVFVEEAANGAAFGYPTSKNLGGLREHGGEQGKKKRLQKRPGASAQLQKKQGQRQVPGVSRWDLRTQQYSDHQREEVQNREEALRDAMMRFAAEAGDESADGGMNVAEQPTAPEDEAAHPDEMDTSSDDDYVYDTFVRHVATDAMSQSPTGTNSKEHIGLLVVPHDDPCFWSLEDLIFDDKSSSEPDWDSEQDDENAENFYGADYPEEELQSDDEFGRDAYGYRQAGSDEEGFDDDYEEVGFRDTEDNSDEDGEAEEAEDEVAESVAYQSKADTVQKVKVKGMRYLAGTGLISGNGGSNPGSC